MRGQIFTFDALFALFILIFAMLALGMVKVDRSALEELALERKATDFVRFLYLDKEAEMVLGLEEGDLAAGVRKVGNRGAVWEDGGIVVEVGERPARFRSKYLLVPVFNSTEFRVVKLDVW